VNIDCSIVSVDRAEHLAVRNFIIDAGDIHPLLNKEIAQTILSLPGAR
jgi:hypothetical protein